MNVTHNYTFTLTVDEVLKGKLSGQPLTFTVNHVSRWHELEIASAEHSSFLWFVNGSEKTIGQDFFDGLNPPNFLFLGPPLVWPTDQNGLDMRPYARCQDMTIITDPRGILTRARAFAGQRVPAPKFHKIYLPESSSEDHFFFNSYLVVPVEPELEKTAKHLIAAPGDFITRTNQPGLIPQRRCDLRVDGVDALQYFKSAQNIRLLKSLLDAPDCWLLPDYSGQHGERNVTNKIYSVRGKAYEVLQNWGVTVPKPVTMETISASGVKL